MTRAAAYIRVSHEEQKLHGLSIEAQTNALDEWAKSTGTKIIDHYVDAGITARKSHSKRPELMRLLGDINAGKIDLIIFTKLDRWFRNISEYYKVQEILEKNNVGWKTIHEDYDTLSASGRLKINIMLSVAQDEADRTSERIKAVFDAKKSRKEPVSGNMPTGYILNGKTIEFDPEWHDAIEVLFNVYLKYASPAFACQEVFKRTGKKISYQLCTIILTNRAYVGFFNGVSGMCPAYITEEQFSEVQRLRKTHPKRPNTGRTYIFGGIAHCAECGHRLAGCCQKSCHKDGTYTEIKYYNCQNHYVRGACDSRANTMEKYIETEALRQLPLIASEYIGSSGAKRIDNKSIVGDASKIKRKVDRLKELFINDLIEMDEYKKEYDKLNTELDKIATYKINSQQINKLCELMQSKWYEVYQTLNDVGTRAFWYGIVDNIKVDKNKSVIISLKF